MINKIFRLDGKNIVIVGGLGILGAVFCETLAEAGASVIIADIDNDKCKDGAEQLTNRFKVNSFGIGVDVADETSVAAFKDTLLERKLTVDVLVNSAATKSKNFFAPLDEFPLTEWDQVMRVNVTGIFLMVRALIPGMIESGGGTIINVGSIYGILGPDQRIYQGSDYPEMGGLINTPFVYSASKGAVSSMTRYLATTFGAQGIRANTLVPGGVVSGQNNAFISKYADRTPANRMGEKLELASALLFLASNASSYVNGQDLIVDGGLSAW